MAYSKNSIVAFFELIRAGLWEKEARLLPFGKLDYDELMNLAEEQSVVGVITAGLESVKDVKIPKEVLLQFIGQTLQLEERNKAMNSFVGDLVDRMRRQGIYALLVKGQGIAQCYERPLWRASGDVDFYLSDDSFKMARDFYKPLVTSDEIDDMHARSINMQYGEWVVEIHTSQHCGLSHRIDNILDSIHRDLFYNGNIRSCELGGTQVFLPSPDNDALLVFTHFLKHFYKGGLGLRQICDWSRLMWTFRQRVNVDLLEKRIKEAGIMSEWKTFGAFAVEYLGMPSEAMPFYDNGVKWSRKAEKIKRFIIEVGNFGHNREAAYNENQPRLIRKVLSYGRRIGDLFHHASIFPLDSFRFLFGITLGGLRAVIHGE